jgi:serine/threonine-protein kinase
MPSKPATPKEEAVASTQSSTGVVSPLRVTPFGKYRLVGKLGHGGMAEVFLAYVAGMAGFRKLCVIKRLHRFLVDEPGFVEMFLDEARLAARLNHPNVVQTHEVGVFGQDHFIAMEYLQGQSLDRFRARCEAKSIRIPPAVTAFLMLEALDGLQHAHELADYDGTPLGVVHRDVSPHNIFVTYDGVTKVLDFGIAKASTHVVQTQSGVVKGKYAYISPEQGRAGDVDFRSDLWSIGVVLWEFLTGQRLFKGPTEVATLALALNRTVPPLSDYVDDASDRLQAIVSRALQRGPDERYQSAAEMKRELKQYLVHEAPECSRADVADLAKRVFAKRIRRERELLQLCLSDSAQELTPATPQSSLVPSVTDIVRVTPSDGTNVVNEDEVVTPVTTSPVTSSRVVQADGTGVTPSGGAALAVSPATATEAGAGAGLPFAPSGRHEALADDAEPATRPDPPRQGVSTLVAVLCFGVGVVGLTYGWMYGHPSRRTAEPASQTATRPERALVVFSSEPTGAQVMLGGIILGQTPLERPMDRLPASSSASFVFRLAGHHDEVVNRAILEERVEVHARLRPVEVASPRQTDGGQADGGQADGGQSAGGDHRGGPRPRRRIRSRPSKAPAATKSPQPRPAAKHRDPTPTVDRPRGGGVPIID